MTPAPLQVGQAPSELALNSAGFTPLAFANALRIGSSSPVYVAGLLRREPLIAAWSTETTPSRPDTEPWISELFPDPATPVSTASTHNLQDVDVDIPLGVLAVLTGVAGSGKSSLIQGSVSGRAGVVSVYQGAIKGSRRSNPATYTGLLDPIRTAFAKVNGVKPSLFSANSEGACPNCNGAGVIYTDLAMMAGVATVCEVCEGKRFEASVLDYHLGGRDISEVLAMSVTEAEEFFGAGEARIPAAHAILDRLADVGLGYLSLGQPLPTLSGGEPVEDGVRGRDARLTGAEELLG